MKMYTILIVDDEPRTRLGLCRMLEASGGGRYRAVIADSGHEALRTLHSEDVDLVITDIRMPGIGGLQLAGRIAGEAGGSRPAVILISGYAEFDYAHEAIQIGVVNYLLKPIGKEKLLTAVERALNDREARVRAAALSRIADAKLLQADYSSLRRPVEEAVAYVDGHLEQPFGLKEVADCVGLSPSYFSALFKEQMGMTFSEYATRRKLLRAKELLVRTKLSVADIAERTGYQTTKYFHRLFKAYEGCSPGQYRAEMAETEARTRK
ncbi:helix-turn-helix domain-containing protein [Paenibacillaceae bacterium WGS1546]|uniref:response regulator transcription factor n=1 Tax=Cohnella sp. WGS1546 TaxID=3366810 RepID=UPI00372D7871